MSPEQLLPHERNREIRRLRKEVLKLKSIPDEVAELKRLRAKVAESAETERLLRAKVTESAKTERLLRAKVAKLDTSLQEIWLFCRDV